MKIEIVVLILLFNKLRLHIIQQRNKHDII